MCFLHRIQLWLFVTLAWLAAPRRAALLLTEAPCRCGVSSTTAAGFGVMAGVSYRGAYSCVVSGPVWWQLLLCCMLTSIIAAEVWSWTCTDQRVLHAANISCCLPGSNGCADNSRCQAVQQQQQFWTILFATQADACRQGRCQWQDSCLQRLRIC
ncbi:hypothetical protein COO60DRAFT_489938 [Scenedesmus sp. NREL 46B-D3]|nr:hypothetical protein COO60DRAFT_489938 [Scenedesmus sp. NREL 46B-D3]